MFPGPTSPFSEPSLTRAVSAVQVDMQRNSRKLIVRETAMIAIPVKVSKGRNTVLQSKEAKQSDASSLGLGPQPALTAGTSSVLQFMQGVKSRPGRDLEN